MQANQSNHCNRNETHLQLLDLLNQGLFLIDGQRVMLLLKLQSPDLGIYLIIIADSQVAILTAEIILDFLLLIQLCAKLVFSSLFLGSSLLLPVSAGDISVKTDLSYFGSADWKSGKLIVVTELHSG